MTPALRLALSPASEALDQAGVSSALYAMARDCGWTITEFHWRSICCTFHLCFAKREGGTVAIVIGADAPILALSDTANVGDELRYIDDAAFGSAASGYAPTMQMLLASELKRELSDADWDWLVSLGPTLDYNLKYWRPDTVGDVIFNTWD